MSFFFLGIIASKRCRDAAEESEDVFVVNVAGDVPFCWQQRG